MMGLRRIRATGEARKSLNEQSQPDASGGVPHAIAIGGAPLQLERPVKPSSTFVEPEITSRRHMRWLPIRLIQYGPRETRSTVDERKLDELAESIRSLGLLQPITVRTTLGNRFELIAGERRMRACERLGWENIDAIVLPAGDVDREMLALAENLQREPLHYLEEAENIEAVRVETGLTLHEIAARLGTSTINLNNKLRLLKIPPETRRLIRELDLNERYARVLLRLNEEGKQRAAAQRIIDKQLTLRDAESLVDTMAREVPTDHRRVTGIIRDHRPYVNAIRDIIDQMRRSGLEPTVETAECDDRMVMTVSLPKIS